MKKVTKMVLKTNSKPITDILLTLSYLDTEIHISTDVSSFTSTTASGLMATPGIHGGDLALDLVTTHSSDLTSGHSALAGAEDFTIHSGAGVVALPGTTVSVGTVSTTHSGVGAVASDGVVFTSHSTQLSFIMTSTTTEEASEYVTRA